MAETETTTTEPTPETTEDSARPTESDQKAVPENAPSSVQDPVDGASTAKAADASGSPDKPEPKADPPAKTPLTDIDARLAKVEAALAAERAARKKPPEPKSDEPPAKKTADQVTNADLKTVPEAAELLRQGKRAEAVLAFLGDQADEEDLIDLAKALSGKTRKEPTLEERIAAEWDRREAKAKAEADARAKAEAEKKAADEARQAEADRAEWETFLKRGAAAQKEATDAGKYPFIGVYGVDAAKFQTKVLDHINKNKAIPAFDAIFAEIEKEYEDHWRKAPLAPKPAATETVSEEIDIDEQIRRSFEDYKPSSQYSVSQDPDEDEARAILAKIDIENNTRRSYR